ncbi:synaptopodin-2 [Syngnathus scovelli]|uniref:synaptopodin-2 n=1 Tax=Syngnathus scovelli TaxID=161590 RepID=UPI00210F5C37|nr:synaptopodin-2 [Syngnathus scovelli]
MEPEAEDSENTDASVSHLDDFQGCGLPESDENESDEERPRVLESRHSKSILEQHYDESGVEEEEEMYEPRKITSPISLFSKSQCHELHSGHLPRPRSSSSSLGSDPQMTLATDEPQGASYRQGQGTENRGVESLEEGGSSEAPPVAVSFGISDESAEQAETWKSESDTDLRDNHGARCKRLDQDENQSQKQVKETKSKCQQIAHLLTDAPNPQNKGALLFQKRRQRVKKYTLVSYGTGKSKFNSEDRLEEIQETGFVTSSESESGEEYSVYLRQHDLSVNWESIREMEVLPGTKGKGVLMFAHRRKRMDEVVAAQELHKKGLYSKAPSEPGFTNNWYNMRKISDHSEQGNFMNRHIHQMDQQRSSVSNRTAKPFSGVRVGPADQSKPAGPVPLRKPEFKVPVPIVSNQQAWSPTGDIIASRDERISVPAIKTCSFPGMRRKSSNKQQQISKQVSDGRESRAYMEPEEDCFSLGAEACNFMQPRAIKLPNPPPVAPKPVINPKCPPWLKSPPSEPCIPPRSSVSQTKYLAEPQRHHHYISEAQKLPNSWEADRAQATIQTPAVGRASFGSSSQPGLQPTTNSWNKPLPRSVVSIQGYRPTFTPQLTTRSKQDSAPSSVASCPPKPMKPITSKILPAPPKGQVFRQGDPKGDRTMTGKGAELFSKRQSRMEKFIIAGPAATEIRCPSPTMSLPHSWRYSSNVRAPPPLSYNPLDSPFYNPKKISAASPKAVPKQINTFDIMKHQPHHLDPSLFHHHVLPVAKSPNAKPAPPSKFDITKKLKQRSAHSDSPNISEPDFESKSEASAKSSAKSSGPGQGTRRSRSLPRPSRSAGPMPQHPRRAFYKPLTPWEAASRSPFGSVDDAFSIHSASSLVASHVNIAATRGALPEPPEEWKRRVSLASEGYCRTTPTYLTSAPMRMKCAGDKPTALLFPPTF